MRFTMKWMVEHVNQAWMLGTMAGFGLVLTALATLPILWMDITLLVAMAIAGVGMIWVSAFWLFAVKKLWVLMPIMIFFAYAQTVTDDVAISIAWAIAYFTLCAFALLYTRKSVVSHDNA